VAARPGSTAFAPLRERAFFLLFAGRTISMVGSTLAPVALAFTIIHLTGSPADLGLVLGATFVPQLVLLLVGGVWADRLPRNVVMVVSDLVAAGAQATLAVLVLLGTAEVWHVVVVAAVRGIAAAFFVPASSGIVPQVVGPDLLQRANALLGMSRNGSAIAGAAVGGLLVAAVGPGWALMADAATYLIGGAFLAFLRIPALPAVRRRFLEELAEGWAEVRSRAWLWPVVLQFTFINAFAWSAFYVLGPFVAEDLLGGAASWGLILTAEAIGMLLGGLAALRFHPTRPLLVGNLGILVIALPLVALALRADVVVVAVAAFVAGVGVELFEVMWATTLQRRVPDQVLSRVSSYDWLGSFALVPVGTMLVGPVAAAVGIGRTLWLAGGVVVVAATVVLAVPAVRRLELEGPAEDAPAHEARLAA
jgi:MFS family permease